MSEREFNLAGHDVAPFTHDGDGFLKLGELYVRYRTRMMNDEPHLVLIACAERLTYEELQTRHDSTVCVPIALSTFDKPIPMPDGLMICGKPPAARFVSSLPFRKGFAARMSAAYEIATTAEFVSQHPDRGIHFEGQFK